MIAAVHLDPRLAGPPAILLAGFLIWYWLRLGADDVPAGRRRIRRISIAFMLIALPNFVRGLSYLDPNVDADVVQYVVSWSVSILLMFIIFFTACVDGMLTMHLNRQSHLAEMLRDRTRDKTAARDDATSGHESVDSP